LAAQTFALAAAARVAKDNGTARYQRRNRHEKQNERVGPGCSAVCDVGRVSGGQDTDANYRAARRTGSGCEFERGGNGAWRIWEASR